MTEKGEVHRHHSSSTMIEVAVKLLVEKNFVFVFVIALCSSSESPFLEV